MQGKRLWASVAAVVAMSCAMAAGCLAAERKKIDEVIDPAQAKADPDFSLQGEYLGKAAKGDLAAQVVALGDGKFDLYFLEGGLPGAGWSKTDPRRKVQGQRQDGQVVFEGQGLRGKIDAGTLTVSDGDGQAKLKRVERHSPTLGAKAPAGAKLLFLDGKGADHWQRAVVSPLGALFSGATTKEKFGDYTLHLEFLLSYMPKATGQARSNSGVYVHNCYEIQVLDSFGLTGENNECGGFYSIKTPDVNMCLPPLVWQTYDVEYTGPKYDAAGKKTASARITVKHNGVAIHNDVELPKATPGGEGEGPGPRVLFLQGHGNRVQFNNIWIVEKKP